MADTGRRSREDFINAALELLAETGSVKALTIDALCEALQVSKGSFYWHFKNRQALISALVDAWSGVFHESIHQRIEQASNHNPRDTFQSTIQFWLSGNFMRMDAVMRDWARQEPAVAEAVARADRLLMDFLCEQFRALGHSDTEAHRRARLLIAIGVAETQSGHLPRAGSIEEEVLWVSRHLIEAD